MRLLGDRRGGSGWPYESIVPHFTAVRHYLLPDELCSPAYLQPNRGSGGRRPDANKYHDANVEISSFLTHPPVLSRTSTRICPGIRPECRVRLSGTRCPNWKDLLHESQCCCPARRPRTALDLSQSRFQISLPNIPATH